MIDYSIPFNRNLKFEGEIMIKIVKSLALAVDRQIELAITKALNLPVNVDIHNGLEKKAEVDLSKCHNPEFDRLILKMRGIKR